MATIPGLEPIAIVYMEEHGYFKVDLTLGTLHLITTRFLAYHSFKIRLKADGRINIKSDHFNRDRTLAYGEVLKMEGACLTVERLMDTLPLLSTQWH